MNTTHINEPTEQNAKSKDAQLLETISLRDYFAAKALQGHLATLPIDFVAKKLNDKALAGWAYAIADAMLAARKE